MLGAARRQSGARRFTRRDGVRVLVIATLLVASLGGVLALDAFPGQFVGRGAIVGDVAAVEIRAPRAATFESVSEPLGTERLLEMRDVAVQRAARRVGWLLAPDLVDQRLGRDELVGADEQVGKDEALFGPAQRDVLTVDVTSSGPSTAKRMAGGAAAVIRWVGALTMPPGQGRQAGAGTGCTRRRRVCG